MCQWSRHFHREWRVPLWWGGQEELIGIQFCRQNWLENDGACRSLLRHYTRWSSTPLPCLGCRETVARGFGHLSVSLASMCKKMVAKGEQSGIGRGHGGERDRGISREKRQRWLREALGEGEEGWDELQEQGLGSPKFGRRKNCVEAYIRGDGDELGKRGEKVIVGATWQPMNGPLNGFSKLKIYPLIF